MNRSKILFTAALALTSLALALPVQGKAPRVTRFETYSPSVGTCVPIQTCSGGCCVVCFPVTSPNGGCARTCTSVGC